MLDNLQCKEALYLGVENILQQWLNSRKALIIEFCKFSQTDWANEVVQKN